MRSAVIACANGATLRDSARKYNVPVTTLYRRVNGMVAMGSRPGPAPVLSSMEDRLAHYLVEMADMGFGLSRQEVMRLAFQIAEESGIKHPFKNCTAGRKWFEAFRFRHPNLTLRTPEALSYARAKSLNPKTIEDFFAKLAAIYARLNLFCRPMQVFNVDESGVNVTQHKGKVIAEVKRKGVHRVVAAEKGKNHTVIACGSASGFVLPPMIIFPRVRVSEALKANAPPGSYLAAQKKGWVTKELYLKWFRFFIEQIPPTRPVLLIQDGHSSHISLELIELAKQNDIHLLCLPSHTTHVLQPLDVGVFSSFKSHVGLALNALIRSSEGRVPTTEDIPKIVAEAWPKSITPVNLMSGFRKTGIHPLNPGCMHDRVTAPSSVIVHSQNSEVTSSVSGPLDTSGSANSLETQCHADSSQCLSSVPKSPTSSLSDTMDKLLTKPKLTRKTRRQGRSHNSQAVCITDDEFVCKLKDDNEKQQKKSSKKGKQPARNRPRTQKTLNIDTDCKSDSITGNEKPRCKQKKQKQQQQIRKPLSGRELRALKGLTPKPESKDKRQELRTSKPKPDKESEDDVLGSECESQSDCECPVCGEHFGDRSPTWIQCNECEEWYDVECAGLTAECAEELPDDYVCDFCYQ